MERRHILVSGRVQGVWYRVTTRQKALALGLVGWVRNLPDSRVEIVAEGTLAQLDELVSWCRRGPSLARVSDAGFTVEEPSGEFSAFEVRY